jgi:hypothetical protein
MDRETAASLHRRKIGRSAKRTKSGQLVDLIRQFRSLLPSQQEEYFIMIGSAVYDPPRIKDLAREIGLED